MSMAMSGVFTGMETDSLIEGLMALEGASLKNLDKDKAEYQAKTDAVKEIQAGLGQLKDSAFGLMDSSKLLSVEASSSDTGVFDVSAGDGALEGSHTIEVNQLAASARMVQDTGVTAYDDPAEIGAGTFEYTYNGVTRTLYTTDETDLEGLQDLINKDGDNPGVRASILEHNGEYHMVLTGQDAGSDYEVNVTGNTDLAAFQPENFLETQTARDAQIKVDGYPADGTWIERSSNTISDVIPGATVTLTGTGTANVSASRDTSDLQTKLETFVTTYNAAMGTIDGYIEYDEENEEAGLLQGDSVFTTMVSRIRENIVTSLPGFDDGDDSYTLAAQLGLEFDKEGVLSLNTSTLNQALNNDYHGVLDTIGALNKGVSDNDRIQFSGAGNMTEAGDYEVEVVFDAGTATSARIRKSGETTWTDMNVNGSIISGAKGTDMEGLQLTGIWDSGTGTQTAEVRVQRGLGGSIHDTLDDILDYSDGAINIKRTQYESAMDRIDDKIDQQVDRLEKKEERLRAKFARLEATLTELDSFRGAFDSAMQSLQPIKAKSGSK
ncbi:MAG: flagellar filament capping protein FliD [Phycisphaerae bacterium]